MAHHGAGLRAILANRGEVDDVEGWVEALAADYRAVFLDEAERAMLDYAARLTVLPSRVSAADLERLRRHGFGDRAIHDLCVLVGYFAFVNRVADGLGVELERGE